MATLLECFVQKEICDRSILKDRLLLILEGHIQDSRNI